MAVLISYSAIACIMGTGGQYSADCSDISTFYKLAFAGQTYIFWIMKKTNKQKRKKQASGYQVGRRGVDAYQKRRSTSKFSVKIWHLKDSWWQNITAGRGREASRRHGRQQKQLLTAAVEKQQHDSVTNGAVCRQNSRSVWLVGVNMWKIRGITGKCYIWRGRKCFIVIKCE